MDRADHTQHPMPCHAMPSVHPSIRPPPSALPATRWNTTRSKGCCCRPSVCRMSSAICPRAPIPGMCHCVSNVQLSLFLSLSRVELLSAPSILPACQPSERRGVQLGGAEGGPVTTPGIESAILGVPREGTVLWARTAVSLVARPCLLPLSARPAHVSSHPFWVC